MDLSKVKESCMIILWESYSMKLPGGQTREVQL